MKSLDYREIGLLVATGGPDGMRWTGKEQKLAHRLVRQGLLRQDVVSPSLFRLTPTGIGAVKLIIDKIEDEGP